MKLKMSSLKCRCHQCKKKMGSIDFSCKFCEHKFCSNCLQPECHKCSNLINCQKKCKDLLYDQLLSNKCVKSKLTKI